MQSCNIDQLQPALRQDTTTQLYLYIATVQLFTLLKPDPYYQSSLLYT